MKTWLYEEARDKLLLDLDLQEEDFVDADELVGYFNDAIDEAEAEILKLHEDYFLCDANLTLVSGTADYALPDTIYANKIRKVLYINGTNIYTVARMRGSDRFEEMARITAQSSSEDYRYNLKNASAAAGVKFTLVPPARESGAFIKIWHIRNANRIPLIADGTLMATEAALIDLPECMPFIFAHVKARVLAKDFDPRLPMATGELQNQRKLMIDTLTEMVPDDDTTVLADLSFYHDHE